jgi:hypothetical protein
LVFFKWKDDVIVILTCEYNPEKYSVTLLS